jgi:hypothetical protein
MVRAPGMGDPSAAEIATNLHALADVLLEQPNIAVVIARCRDFVARRVRSPHRGLLLIERRLEGCTGCTVA